MVVETREPCALGTSVRVTFCSPSKATGGATEMTLEAEVRYQCFINYSKPDASHAGMRGIGLKFNPLPEVLSGKRVVVVDDSIVRGTTTPRVISILRRAGAREVHMRITAPPMKFPCYLGVDTARREELIAHRMTVPEICAHIGADSLGYLSLGGLFAAVTGGEGGGDTLCQGCFTGNYPMPVQMELPLHGKLALEIAEESPLPNHSADRARAVLHS